ncbi:MAG: hypothetical protein ACKPKO_21315, partial [Candidatus Fonsibacter sp.]
MDKCRLDAEEALRDVREGPPTPVCELVNAGIQALRKVWGSAQGALEELVAWLSVNPLADGLGLGLPM